MRIIIFLPYKVTINIKWVKAGKAFAWHVSNFINNIILIRNHYMNKKDFKIGYKIIRTAKTKCILFYSVIVFLQITKQW